MTMKIFSFGLVGNSQLKVMNILEFVSKIKEFNLKKDLKAQEDSLYFHKLYKEILANIEIVKKEILIPLWENPTSYHAIAHCGCILMEDKIHIRDFRISKLTYLNIDKNRVMISLEGHILNDNYKLVQKGIFNDLVLNNTEVMSVTEAVEYLEFFNEELKSLIKHKSRIYKNILKNLF